MGAKVDYLDKYNYFAGWKTIFTQTYDRVRFNEVDFGTKAPSKIVMRARSESGAELRISAGTLGKNVVIPACAEWTVLEVPTSMKATGMQDVSAELISGKVEIDWISFR